MKLFRLGLLMGAFAFCCNVSFAQIQLGPGVSYPFEVEEIGIMVKAVIPVTDKIDISPSFTYYLTADGLTAWSLDGDGHYHFGESEKVGFYGLAGINFFHVGVDLDIPILGFATSSTEVGLNVGAGLEFRISEKLELFGEVKYTISDFDQLSISAGLLFDL